jgi:hypothetical protein
MTDIFLERTFDPAVGISEILDMWNSGKGCFGLHRVDWQMSLLSAGGRQMVFRFSGPGIERRHVPKADT